MIGSLLLLFGSAFLAATILPFYSEVILFALLREGGDPFVLVLVATLGNTLGAADREGTALVQPLRFLVAADGVAAGRWRRADADRRDHEGPAVVVSGAGRGRKGATLHLSCFLRRVASILNVPLGGGDAKDGAACLGWAPCPKLRSIDIGR